MRIKEQNCRFILFMSSQWAIMTLVIQISGQYHVTLKVMVLGFRTKISEKESPSGPSKCQSKG